YTIEEDNSGDIWVGGQKGLSIYNVLTSKFSKVRYTSLSGSLENLQDNVHLVKAVGPDCILVATQHTGLLLFKKGTANGLQISLNDLHSGDYDVTALEQSTDHRLWVFVQHEGLFSYDLTQKKLLRVNSSILQGNCLKTDRKGRLWLANDAGLFLYDPKSNGYSGNFMPAKVKIVTLCSDKQGALWIGSDGTGLWALPDNAPLASPMTGSNGRPLINSNSAFTIYEDAEGRKWINHRQLDCLLYPISPSLFYFFPNLLGK
ncbi:MAG TPA: two-component regulator propeller domain-containing protein, partial [Mucilaginibacter sp.]